MEWIDVNDQTKEIPFTKVCVWDGGNTFWAYLQKVETTSSQRILTWNIITPENYPDCKPLFWMKIFPPK